MTPERQMYSKSPLTQAVISVQLEHAAGFEPETIREALEGEFSASKPELFPSLEEAAEAAESPSGAVVRLDNDKTVLYATSTACVAVRFAPYEDWAVFRPNFARLWRAYSALVPSHKLLRIGLRYTNELPVSASERPLPELLTIYPVVSESLRDLATANSHAQQLANVRFESGGFLVSVLVSDESSDAGRKAILDLDVAFDSRAVPGIDLNVCLEQMHTVINSSFETCITDHMREIIR